MADYPTTPNAASTPEILEFPRIVPVLTPALTPVVNPSIDPAAIEQLLVALERIPRKELPDGEERNVLAMLIRWGWVDNLYRPIGADYHNIAWSFMPADQDPRMRVSVWLSQRDTSRAALERFLLSVGPKLGWAVTHDGE